MSHPAYSTVRDVLPFASVVLQRNPGPMTLDGTNTWLLGAGAQRVLVDPGQDVGDTHLDDLIATGPVDLVLLTHRHHDHVELAGPLHERTGVAVRAVDPAHCHGGGPLTDGEVLEVGDLRIEVLATAGHTSDSASFVVRRGDDVAALAGDTILGRGTTVVAHPDGNLADYLGSLRRLEALGDIPVLPGHGPELPSVARVAAHYLAHREQRLDQIRAALDVLGADATAGQVVEHVYADVPEDVRWAAELSVRAQLDYLARP